MTDDLVLSCKYVSQHSHPLFFCHLLFYPFHLSISQPTLLPSFVCVCARCFSLFLSSSPLCFAFSPHSTFLLFPPPHPLFPSNFSFTHSTTFLPSCHPFVFPLPPCMYCKNTKTCDERAWARVCMFFSFLFFLVCVQVRVCEPWIFHSLSGLTFLALDQWTQRMVSHTAPRNPCDWRCVCLCVWVCAYFLFRLDSTNKCIQHVSCQMLVGVTVVCVVTSLVWTLSAVIHAGFCGKQREGGPCIDQYISAVAQLFFAFHSSSVIAASCPHFPPAPFLLCNPSFEFSQSGFTFPDPPLFFFFILTFFKCLFPSVNLLRRPLFTSFTFLPLVPYFSPRGHSPLGNFFLHSKSLSSSPLVTSNSLSFC